MTGFVFRYLWCVSPHFSHATTIAVVLVCFGLWTLSAMPQDVGAPYLPILFCQLFAASSGENGGVK